MSNTNFATHVLLLTVLLAFLTTEAYAFGAGDIPDFGYLADKAFRHGDIEAILSEISKGAGGAAGGAGLLGFAKSMLDKASGNKFSKSDIKKVYFGNWLRDYSQAMDIAGLSKLSAETLVLIVSILGFMTFGFATEEFEVTADRLGVYLPTEHIDNPKGYAEKEGDARQFHPKLRPPVDPQELEIDERTGMKKYMATEGEEWDTSTALIRRVFRECIERGRNSGGRDGDDLWEAYRLLGTGLHTMEDLLAHSNWCEIALKKMGHSEVFCHVGDNVVINTPNGEAPPLVTGTFGGADFLHSLMGEATDHLSQSSVTDLSANLDQAANNGDSNTGILKDILAKLPIGGSDDKMDQGEQMHEQAKAYNFDPNNVAPPEVRQQLWDLLKWRDQIYRDVVAKIEMVPGLSDLMESLTNALNAYVYTVLAPYLTPILQQVTSALGEGSKAVIDSDDQYEVFNNPDASDPSHSLLSKDHFALILNEPAGKIAQVVVQNSTTLIVEAWSDNSDPDQVIDRVLEAFHHPYYAEGNSQIQQAMFQTFERWFGGLGPEEGEKTLEALTKDSVREGKNKRFSEEQIQEVGGSGCGHKPSSYKAPQMQSNQGGYAGSQSQSQSSYGQGGRTSGYGQSGEDSYGGRSESHQQSSRYGGQDDNSYGGRNEQSYGGESNTSYGGRSSYGRQEESESGYGRQGHHSSYGQQEQGRYDRQESEYGRQESQSYGRQEENNYGRQESEGYGGRRHEESGYGRQETQSYGRQESNEYGGYSSNRQETSYGGQERQSYGRGDDESQEHHGHRKHHKHDDDEDRSNSYGRQESSYGQNEDSYSSRQESSGYGRQESSGYGDSGYGGRDEGRSQYQESSGYNPSYGSRDDESSGYNPSYGGDREEHRGHHGRMHHGDDEDTFGAERLNLEDNEGYGGGRRQREDYY